MTTAGTSLSREPRRSRTSVVVPDRLRATTRSYARPAGTSEAAKASVSPSPADSRSTAYAIAMNHDVPHPTTATRSPTRGRWSRTWGSWATACFQHSGWLAISAAVYVTICSSHPFGMRSWAGRHARPAQDTLHGSRSAISLVAALYRLNPRTIAHGCAGDHLLSPARRRRGSTFQAPPVSPVAAASNHGSSG